MILRALLAVPAILVPLGPARDEPLEIAVVDTASFPTVTVDIVAPVRHTSQRITAAMVEVDGAAVESVRPVDPGDVVVGLVVDDRPETTPEVVTGLQGAAVELVRNVSDGIQISLGTPSGLRTALTADRGANIARIAGITAGAPAVIPLPDVLTETVAELASSPAGDRHAFVVLGGALELTGPQAAAFAEALAGSGTALHVLLPEGVKAGALARIAAGTGGSTQRGPTPLASVDRVTATIASRYRVTARVSAGGAHRLRLTLGGERFGAGFEASATSATGPAEPAEPGEPGEPVAPAPTEEPTPQQEATGGPPPAATTPSATLDSPPASGQGALPLRAIGLGALAVALVGLVGAGALFLVRRRGAGDDAEAVLIEKPSVAAASTSMATPMPNAGAKASTATKPPAPLASRARPRPAVAPPAQEAEVTPPATKPLAPLASRARPRPAVAPPAPEAEVTPPAKSATPSREARVERRSRTARSGRVTVPPPAVDGGGDEAGWIVAGDVRVSAALGEVWCGDRRVELSPPELGILELLITSGGQGVTREAIIAAGQLDESDGPDAVDAMVAQVRRKTGVRGRGNVVRKERVVTYFLEGAGADPEV